MADIYGGLKISRDLVDKFNDARTKTNAALDKPSLVKLNNTELTYRAIYEVFLWGGLAHANRNKKAVYDSWVSDPTLFPLLQNEFIHSLGIILNMIFFTRALNNNAFSQLQKRS